MQTKMLRRMTTQRTMKNYMDFNRLMFENKEEHVTRDIYVLLDNGIEERKKKQKMKETTSCHTSMNKSRWMIVESIRQIFSVCLRATAIACDKCECERTEKQRTLFEMRLTNDSYAHTHTTDSGCDT